MAADIAPGLLRRRFGFERWLQHEPAVWEALRAVTLERRRTDELGAGRFMGYDRDQTAIRASLANSGRSSVGDHLLFERRELAHLSRAAASHGLVLVNPPYGARLDEAGMLEPMYGLLGAKLMECFPGWEAGVFTGNPPLAGPCGCAPTGRTRSSTGRSSAGCCASNSCRRPSSPTRRRSAARGSKRHVRGRVRRCSATGCARTPAPRGMGEARGRRVLPRLRCRHAGVRLRRRPLR